MPLLTKVRKVLPFIDVNLLEIVKKNKVKGVYGYLMRLVFLLRFKQKIFCETSPDTICPAVVFVIDIFCLSNYKE